MLISAGSLNSYIRETRSEYLLGSFHTQRDPSLISPELVGGAPPHLAPVKEHLQQQHTDGDPRHRNVHFSGAPVIPSQCVSELHQADASELTVQVEDGTRCGLL